MKTSPPALPKGSASTPTKSMLSPWASPSMRPRLKGFILPGVVFVVLVFGLFVGISLWQSLSLAAERAAAAGDLAAYKKNLEDAASVLALFVISVGCIILMTLMGVLYRMCGRSKPIWVLLASALMTIVGLSTPWWSVWATIFHAVVPEAWEKASVFPRLAFFTIAVGMAEESFKILPVLFFLWLGRRVAAGRRDGIGVWQPLDGILLGAASGAGFTLLETGGQYFQSNMADSAKSFAEAAGAGTDLVSLVTGKASLFGVGIGIARFFHSGLGHIAWSATFGYFVGLAVMWPKKWPHLLGLGLLLTACLHGVFDAIGGAAGFASIGLMSFMIMIAVIMKAREISPTRGQNFATIVAQQNQPHGTPWTPPRLPFSLAPVPPQAPHAALSLRVGSRNLAIVAGKAVTGVDLPGLTSAGGSSLVGEFISSTTRPGVIGLRNLSTVSWTVSLPDGRQMMIAPRQVITIARGMRFNFGTCSAVVA